MTMCLSKLKKYSKYNVFLIRILIGVTFLFYHGWTKLTAGPGMWAGIGGSMAMLGLAFVPTFWGMMAMIAEFFGSLLILLGLFTRYAAVLLGLTMLTALLTVHRVDILTLTWKFELALVYLVLCIVLLFSGPGEVFNLEKKLFRKEL